MQPHLQGGQREAFKEPAHGTVRLASLNPQGRRQLGAEEGHPRDSLGAAALSAGDIRLCSNGLIGHPPPHPHTRRADNPLACGPLWLAADHWVACQPRAAFLSPSARWSVSH